MPRPSPKIDYDAIPVRDSGRIVFSDGQKAEFKEILANVANDEQCNCLIQRLEWKSQWLLPWEQRKVPSLAVRQKGLLKVASLAGELGDAINESRGFIGADWHFLDRQLFLTDGTQLTDIKHLLMRVQEAAGFIAARCDVNKVAADKPMDRLAGIVALEFWEVLKVMPTIGGGATWKSSPYSMLTISYANAVRGRLVTWGQVQQSVSRAVKALRAHLDRP